MLASLPTGTLIAHYRLLACLGVGGMGEVYLAEDTRLGRKIALKILPAAFTQHPERLARFEQEARAASALNHPNIITVYEIGQHESWHFIAFEYVDGETLRDRLAKTRLPLAEAVDIALQAATALEAAHAAGITHRDIKPENIMLRPDGYVKLLDFGLAKLTEKSLEPVDPEAVTRLKPDTDPGMIMGTVRYMSPEQARGQAVDARSDIFSLGVMLYEMVAQRLPFEGETASDVIAAILRQTPAPLRAQLVTVPVELEFAVAKALCKEREERHQVISELCQELRELKTRLTVESALAGLSQAPGPGQQFSSRAGSLSQFPTAISIANTADKAPARRARKAKATKSASKVIDSLAILPFANISRDSQMEYLSDGITESIINSLSQLPRLRVLPASTVARFKGQIVDPQQIGQELRVRALLLGRVQQVANALIIKTELIDVAHNAQLWGAQYRRQLTDIFALQDEISQEISHQLRLQLSGEEQRKLVKHYTDNTEAYHLYLKGRHCNSKRTPQWIKKGIEFFQQAIDLDPNYALAYAGMADSYGFLASATGGHPPREVYPKAKAAALKALELDDTLGEAHCSLGFFHLLYDWDFAAAEREYKRAIELSPNYANAHDGYSFYLKATGQTAAAIRECQLAQQLDPLSSFATVSLGWAYYFARRYDEALAQGQKVLELDANFGFAYAHSGLCHLQLGDFAQAVVCMRKAVNLVGGSPHFLSYLGHALGKAGQPREARQMLAQLERLTKKQFVSAYFTAIVYLGLGNRHETLTWLERALEERSGFLPFAEIEPMLDELRAEPRFVRLIERIKAVPSEA